MFDLISAILAKLAVVCAAVAALIAGAMVVGITGWAMAMDMLEQWQRDNDGGCR